MMRPLSGAVRSMASGSRTSHSTTAVPASSLLLCACSQHKHTHLGRSRVAPAAAPACRLRSTQAAILSVADKSALLGPSLVPAAPNSKKLTAALPVSHAMRWVVEAASEEEVRCCGWVHGWLGDSHIPRTMFI
eukprot:1159547-Pelagomonas_calceolata.AAC.4